MSRTVCVGFAAVLLLAAGHGATAAPPVNVVVILVDDLGWRDVGYAGSSFYRTPHIDRLAASVRFLPAKSRSTSALLLAGVGLVGPPRRFSCRISERCWPGIVGCTAGSASWRRC